MRESLCMCLTSQFTAEAVLSKREIYPGIKLINSMYKFQLKTISSNTLVTDMSFVSIFRMKKKKGLARDFTQNGQTYHNAFMGSTLVGWLTGRSESMTHDDAILLGRQLLENNIIRHGET